MKEYWRLLAYLKPYWFRLTFTVFSVVSFSLLDGASMSLSVPLLKVLFGNGQSAGVAAGAQAEGFFDRFEILRRIQERILEGGPLEVLSRIVIMIVLIFLLKNFFDYFQRFLSRSLEQLAVRDLRDEIFSHLNSLSLSFFHKNKTGQLISCMSNDVNTVRVVLTDSFSKILLSGCQIVVYLALLFLLSWKLTLVAFALIPPMAWLVTWVAKKLRRKNFWLQTALGEITSIFQEAVSGIRVVKAFGMENFERAKFSSETQSYYRQFMRTNRYASLSSPMTETLMTFVGGIFLLYGGRQVLARLTDACPRFFLFPGRQPENHVAGENVLQLQRHPSAGPGFL